jgi:hypothetical protein
MYGATNLAISQNWVSTYFGNLNYAYGITGSLTALSTLAQYGDFRSRNYSSDKILGIFTKEELKNMASVPASGSSGARRPNVICADGVLL